MSQCRTILPRAWVGLLFAWICVVPALRASVLYQTWTNLPWEPEIYALTGETQFLESPGRTNLAASFEAPANQGDHLGQRLSAVVTVPISGTYRFYLAADDTAELWFSSNGVPALARRIAQVIQWTPPRAWNNSTNQVSAAMSLAQGQTIYLEAIGKENSGGDHLSVGWSVSESGAAQWREAENCPVVGAVRAAAPNARGQGFVDFTAPAQRIVLTNIVASAESVLHLAVTYANGRPNQWNSGIDIVVDGTLAHTWWAANTGGWTNWSVAQHAVPLSAGQHTVELVSRFDHSPSIDVIQLQMEGAIAVVPGSHSTPYDLGAHDTDRDLLDDRFEVHHFGDLSQTAVDDLDGDSITNLGEAASRMDPTVPSGLIAEFRSTLTDQLLLRRGEANINRNWGTASPAPGVPAAGFSIVYQGWILPLSSEHHTFTLLSRGGARLWLNNELIINDFAPHWDHAAQATRLLSKGQLYHIRVEFYDANGSARLHLFWQTPTRPREIVPADRFYPIPIFGDEPDTLPDAWEIQHFGHLDQTPLDDPDQDGASNQDEFDQGTDPNRSDTDGDLVADGDDFNPKNPYESVRGGGLRGDYFAPEHTGPLLTRTDPSIAFDWDHGSPHPSLPADFFSARWSGKLKPPADGTYRFRLFADNGGRLTVDGSLAIDGWRTGTSTNDSPPISLHAGRWLDLTLEYFENDWKSGVRLEWAGPGFGFRPIPSEYLFRPESDSWFSDRDQDGMDDSSEIAAFGSLSESGGGDFDGDGVANADELSRGTDPVQMDSDADGSSDGADSAPLLAAVPSGLAADYFDDKHLSEFVFSRRDAQVAFDWLGIPPGPGIHRDSFSVRWRGFLVAPQTGLYSISATYGKGVRIWIDGHLLFHDWNAPWDQGHRSAPIHLQAGEWHPITVEYMKLLHAGHVTLSWAFGGSNAVPIPNEALRPADQDSDGDGATDAFELARLGSDPLDAADRSDVVQPLLGLLQPAVGPWTETSEGHIACIEGKGHLQGQLTVPASGYYAIVADLERPAPALALAEPPFLRLSLGDRELDAVPVTFSGPGRAGVELWAGWLEPGSHQLRIVLDNPNPRAAVTFRAAILRGWTGIAARPFLARGNRIVGPLAFDQSPASLTGVADAPDGPTVWVNGQSYPASPGPARVWYADVPLNPDTPTSVAVGFLNGQHWVTNQVTWRTTDLASCPSPIVVRQGDALKFALEDAPDGTVAVVSAGNWATPLVGRQPFVFRFDQVDQPPLRLSSGVTNRTLTVYVVPKRAPARLPLVTGLSRSLPGFDEIPGAQLLADPALHLLPEPGERRLITWRARPARALIQLSSGAIVGDLNLEPFRILGSQLGLLRRPGPDPNHDWFGVPLDASPHLPEDVRVQVTSISGGICLDDGSGSRVLTRPDFGSVGTNVVWFLAPTEAPTSICHFLQVFHGTNVLRQ